MRRTTTLTLTTTMAAKLSHITTLMHVELRAERVTTNNDEHKRKENKTKYLPISLAHLSSGGEGIGVTVGDPRET